MGTSSLRLVSDVPVTRERREQEANLFALELLISRDALAGCAATPEWDSAELRSSI